MQSQTILAGDGARAWKSSAKQAQKPFLKGVKHGQRLFTPPSRVDRADVSKDVQRFIDKASTKKIRAAKRYKKHWVLAGGDNTAEGLIGAVKQTARRVGSVRGGRLRHGGHLKAVQVQSSAQLLRQSGFTSVLEACKLFREQHMQGKFQLSPSDAFVPEKHPWLLDSETAEAK
eukprot:Skav202957  [mRNA]  locus=scaffold2274:108889:109407:+ [translate_table: standard]